MIVEIENFDGMAPPIGATEPMRITLLRRFASSPDGSEYWLGRPEAPFAYRPKDSAGIIVSHVVVGPGWNGQSFDGPNRDGRVNLAYVTDASLLEDEVIDFAKCDYVAYGAGRVIEEGL